MDELDTNKVILPAVMSHCLFLASDILPQDTAGMSSSSTAVLLKNHESDNGSFHLFNFKTIFFAKVTETVLALDSNIRENIITVLKEFMV